jgi:hypothetical protein
VRIYPWVLLAAACGNVESEPSPVTVERCSYAVCGSNSGVIDHYAFHELNLDGIPNREGFSILGMSQGATFYDLRVYKDRIEARGTTAVLTGQALLGARIYLAHKNGLQYAMTIRNVGSVEEVVAPNSVLDTYDFQWAVITQDPLPAPVHAGDVLPIPGFDKTQDICPAYIDTDGAAEWDEAARFVAPASALVFEGDRIDAEARTVSPTTDKRWFNIACGRDTLLKLRLSRSTMRLTGGNWRLGQATLKMFSADYCGTGMSFTMRGEPITWRSISGMEMLTSPSSFEARWDENGARCLEEPRALNTTNTTLAAQYPDIADAIKQDCATVARRPPPPCSNPDPAIYDPGDLVISGNRD